MINIVKLILIFALTILILGCRTIYPELGNKMLKNDMLYFPSLSKEFTKRQKDCIEKKESPCNFPEPNDSLSDFVNQWYSRHLYSMKAPILFNKTDKQLKVFRYTNLGTWSNPISYQIELNDSIVTITYKRTKGLGGYKAGRLIKNKHRTLQLQDWEALLTKVDSTNFWTIPSHDTNMILDGAEWIFEGLFDNKYHIVTRNSPDDYGGKDYASLCNFIEELYRKNK